MRLLLALTASLAMLLAGLAGCGQSSSSSSPSHAVDRHTTIQWTNVGRSVQGREIEVATLGTGPQKALVIGGIHGDEYGTYAANQLVTSVRENPGTVGAGWQLQVIP